MLNNSITIEVGENQACVEIMIIGDSIFEETESFYISITGTSPPININQTVMSGASIEDQTGGMYIGAGILLSC